MESFMEMFVETKVRSAHRTIAAGHITFDRLRHALLCSVCTASTLLLSGCGAGVCSKDCGGTPPSTSGDAVVSQGTLAAANTQVNGTSYAVGSAGTLQIDDRLATIGEFLDGMMVTLRGRRASGGQTGTIDRMESRAALRATVQTVSASTTPTRFVACGQTVIFDGTTRLSPGLLATGLADRFVEVHGQRDPQGRIRATLITVPPDTTTSALLSGTVSALGVNAVTVGGVVVNLGNTIYIPNGVASAAALALGQTITARGVCSGTAAASTLTATALRIEPLNDERNFTAARNTAVVQEGRVGTVSSQPATRADTFTLPGRTVQLSSTTVVADGGVDDLASGQLVEVEGTLSGAVLNATRLRFRDPPVVLIGRPSAVDVDRRTLTLFGRTVVIDDLTVQDIALTRVSAGLTRLDVRAMVNNGTLRAVSISDTGSGASGLDVIQARIDSESSTGVVVLGVNASLQRATLRAPNGSVYSTLTAFLNAARAPGSVGGASVVRVSGLVGAGGTLDARDADLRD